MAPGSSAFASTSSTPFRCAAALLRASASSRSSRGYAAAASARPSAQDQTPTHWSTSSSSSSRSDAPVPNPFATLTSSATATPRPASFRPEPASRTTPRSPPAPEPAPEPEPEPPSELTLTSEHCDLQLAELIRLHAAAALARPESSRSASSQSQPAANILADALTIASSMSRADLRPTSHTYDLLLQCCFLAQEDRLAALPKGVLNRGSVSQVEDDVVQAVSGELNWLEKRTKLFLPWKIEGMQTGVWFGSAEWEIGWGLFLDANKAGVRLSRVGLDALMKLAHIHPTLATRVTSLLTHPSFAPTPHSFEISLISLLSIPTSSNVPFDPSADLDRILSIYADARAEGLFPTAETVNQIAARLVAVGYSNAAVDLMVDFEENSGDVAGLDADVWGSILRGICSKKHAAAMITAWQHSVDTGKLTPDVGLTLQALHLASASGLPEFAISLTEVLKHRGVPLSEEHLGPIVFAWCQVGDLEAAMHSLAVMRAEGVAPSPETGRGIVQLIVGGDGAVDLADEEEVRKVTESVDQAWFVLVESKDKRGVADVAAANAVMLACLSILDFVRCAETFEELSSLGITPDVDTYDILLDACLLRPTETAPLFQRILDTLSTYTSLTPRTHERIIAYLCTQPFETSSSSFLSHLAESRAHPDGPTRRSYELIVRRLAQEGDGRTMEVVKEMNGQGYMLSASLRHSLFEAGFGSTLQEMLGERKPRGIVGLRKPVDVGGRSQDWYAGRVAPHLSE